MESELKTLNPNPTQPAEQGQQHKQQAEQAEPADDNSNKDDRPLLKPEPGSDPDHVQSLNPDQNLDLDELEKKYAAFVRRDVYGIMGRGELPLVEKVLLCFALVTLVPVRVVLGMTVLVVYYLICRVCTAFLAPNREEEQEDYAHMGGWRRAVIVHCGRFLSRAMLFVFGFYWISEYRRDGVDADFDGKFDSEVPS